MHIEHNDNPLSADGLRIGVAVSRYHRAITEKLESAAVETFVELGGGENDVIVVPAPGAFELVAVCRALLAEPDEPLDAVVALGCVITGETTHDAYINQAVAHGLVELTIDIGAPAAFGLLTCQTVEQAEARAGGDKGNKGAEAMRAAIETVRSIRSIQAMNKTNSELRAAR